MKIGLEGTIIINEQDGTEIMDIMDNEPQLMLLIVKQLIQEKHDLEDKITDLREIIHDKNDYIEMLEDNR